jgi:membrane associated rhomboid family serine protease
MRDAAVGFQCPNCVAGGAKQTRSGRTAYGGQRSRNPALTSITLISINVFVWLLILATGGRDSDWVYHLALVPDYSVNLDPGGQSGILVDGVAHGASWQLITNIFTHVDALHIAFNMLALWFLGPQLELAIGRAGVLVLFVLSGLSGSACVMWLSNEHTLTLGASGAIFGLMGALLVVAYKVGGDVQNILVWIGINAAITVVGSSFISWQGHLGGFLGGLALMGLIVYAPRGRRTLWQVTGFVLLALTLAVVIVARTTALA